MRKNTKKNEERRKKKEEKSYLNIKIFGKWI
jgi:hypothetical protein